LLEEGFGITGTYAEGKKLNGVDADLWNGVSDVILGNKEWFEAWMEGERKCEIVYSITSSIIRFFSFQLLRISTMRSSAHQMRGSLLMTMEMSKGSM
jgi:hypothetical protein